MPSKVENKWRINREKNAFAKKLREFSLTEQQPNQVEVSLNEPCDVKAYTDGTLWLSDKNVWDNPEKTWIIINELRDWLELYHPDYLEKLDQWKAKDKEAARQARLAKIMGAIGNNLDDLPELKDEILKLAEMIESGEEIQAYCRQFGE